MSIKVKFFGSVRETLNQSSCLIGVDDVSTVTDVWNRATDNAPIQQNIFCSVNLEHRDLGYPVADGDEVAFFPPVTGG